MISCHGSHLGLFVTAIQPFMQVQQNSYIPANELKWETGILVNWNKLQVRFQMGLGLLSDVFSF